VNMALITISEASRLAGKNRTTIYKYINNRKLSVVVSVDGVRKIDTSELFRVFPDCKIEIKQHPSDNTSQQQATDEINSLKQEIQHLKELMSAQRDLLLEKDKRNEDLKQALLLIELKLPVTSEPFTQLATKKSWKFGKNNNL